MMLWIIAIIIIIICVVVSRSNHKKKTQGPVTSEPASPVQLKPTKSSAPPKAGEPLDQDAFARAFAGLKSTATGAGASAGSNEAQERKWVREHPFTDYISEFYARAWGPNGSVYQKIVSGTLPIVRFTLQVESDQIQEKLYLKQGDSFNSQTTFASFRAEGQRYQSLDTSAKRDELYQCIKQRLSRVATIRVQNDGFEVLSEGGSEQKPPEPKKSAPPKAGDALDQDAFARAFAHMGVKGAPAPSPVPEPPKPAPEPPKPAAPAFNPEDETGKAFLAKVLQYYDNLWNRETGSIYTDLDVSMPIDHFAVQVRADRLVESIWLTGDQIPLVNETTFEKLAEGVTIPDCSSEEAQNQLLVSIAMFLVELGTVEIRGNDFYPIRGAKPQQSAPQPAPQPAEPPSGGAADPDAKLRAEITALLGRLKDGKI